METAQIIKKMVDYSDGNIPDINHFLHVWAYAKTIAELEGIDEKTKYIIETAAIIHDIACPLCREKYGNTNGKYQEKEGAALAEEFLSGTGMTKEQIERVAYLVAHHHTFSGIDGIDYQILIEADYIVNACERGYSRHNIENFIKKFVKTKSGTELLRSVLSRAV